MRGQFAVPPGLKAPAPRALRLVGFASAALGLALIAGSFGYTAFSATPCDNNGLPNPCVFTPGEDEGEGIGSLKAAEPIQQDPQLNVGGPFIANRTALLQLGKALFWDTQVGSDGQACASCHFIAGADNRVRNAVSPGMNVKPTSDKTFQTPNNEGPNNQLNAADFPLHKLADINNRNSTVRSDSNDTVGSQGVFNRTFVSVPNLNNQSGLSVQQSADTCTSVRDPDGFTVTSNDGSQTVNVRRVEPRNTPTTINVGFQNRQFWDARAQEVFNGIDPFGGANQNGTLLSFQNGALSNVRVRIAFAGTASQAVGPPLNGNEMSCNGRTFPDLGHKLFGALPLGRQAVAANDSVLGPIARSRTTAGALGLSTSYLSLVQQAFNSRWWSDPNRVTVNGRSFTQAEANFSLFWGLSVGAYLNSQIADNSPVDQFFDGNRAILSASARRGLNLFQSFQGTAPDPTDATGTRRVNVNLASGAPADLRCISCHGHEEMTNASIRNVHEQREERMTDRHGQCVIYDQGQFHTGVRRLTDDPLEDASDPFGFSFANLTNARSGRLSLIAPNTPQNSQPFGLDNVGEDGVTGPNLGGTVNCEGDNITGTAKVPGLRNIELTGPYFHNGGQATLMQVVDFYNRGGDFDNVGIDENIKSLGLTDQDKTDLVTFLLALTDNRVAFEQAPFDHPSLCVPNGENGDYQNVAPATPLPGGGFAIDTDTVMCINAVGANGRSSRLPTFLNNLSQFQH